MKSYECRIDNYFDGFPLISNHIAKSPAAARYKFWMEHSDFLTPYKDCFPYIKSKSLGKINPSHYFGDINKFQSTAKYRRIEKAYQGMKIEVCGTTGIIVGANHSGNLDVLFPDYSIQNCHPHYKTVYFDNDGNIVYDFKTETE